MNTVFVIGAGASKEVGLPTGEELKGVIAKLLDLRWHHGVQVGGDSDIDDAIKYAMPMGGVNESYKKTIQSALHIRDALPQAISIDNFVDAHRDDESIAFCSKLAIVKAMLSSECKSLLHSKYDNIKRKFDFSALNNTWYIRFFQLITENCDKSDLGKRLSSVKLIIFNYDRCVEHFLYHAFINYYQISESDAAELISKITIYHPYGSVGDLPWMERGESIDFGGGLNHELLVSLSERIKTFTEGVDPGSSEVKEIKKVMIKAERVAFIGFAFHKLNMELISPERLMAFGWEGIKCFATTYQVSKSDQAVIKNQIQSIYGDDDIEVVMSDTKCNDFFKEFSKSLSFS